MNIKKLSILLFFIIIMVGSPCFADWQSDLENGIPGVIKVVTFDDYDDWSPGVFGDKRQTDDSLNGIGFDGPTKNSGQDTNWDVYNMWNESEPAGYLGAVRAWGSKKCTTGKCLTTSYNVKNGVSTYDYYDQVGPNNVALNFGNGSEHDYQEIYIFFRTYIPSNRWPTENGNQQVDFDSTAGGNPVVKHVNGNNYAQITSEKWIIPLTSRLNSRDYKCLATGQGGCNYAGEIIGGFKTYRYDVSDIERIIHIKNLNRPSRQMKLRLEVYHHEGGGYTNVDGGVDIAPYFDKLVGIETHWKIESIAGKSGNAVVEAWMYDENGTASKVLDSNGTTLNLLQAAQRDGNGNAGFSILSLVYNCRAADSQISGGGYYRCGDNMECNFMYDDIIISQSRVGPNYYSLIAGNPVAMAPNPPRNLRVGP